MRGTFQLKCRYKKNSTKLDFYVIDTNAPPVLAMKTCRDLNLIKIVMAVSEECKTSSQSILKEYADLFQGIGEFPGECRFRVAPDATPVLCPPRRIPIALHNRLKDEFDSMEKNTEPTEWVNALVVDEKPKTGNL